MTRSARQLQRLDDSGTTSIEFAMVAPLLFFFIFGLIEIYFVLFNFQQVQAVASQTARCYAVGAASCNTVANAQSYAANQAAPGHGIDKLVTNDVQINQNTSCGTQGNMVQVVITYPIANAMPVNFIPSVMSQSFQLVGVGCFPYMPNNP